MNPQLEKLHPYPFEKLRQLFAGVTPNPDFPAISLGMGEPKHPTPPFIHKALTQSLQGLASYPSTIGSDPLRAAIAAAQAELLDELLWEFDPDAYVPHQIAGTDEDDDITPVLIVAPEMQAPMRPLVLNLRAEPVSGEFTRVLEVVPADESARGPLRARGAHYKSRGLEVQKFDM